MARVCKITGKKPLTGHNVSHSNRKTKMRQFPNLRKKRFFDEETGRTITLRVSASGLRNITKLGLKKALAKAAAST
jgi:large subunit ribosomal protein L28